VVLAPTIHINGIVKGCGDPHPPRHGPPEMLAFRQRPSITEFPNAECRNRGLQQFRVCGLKKIKTVSLPYAGVFNFLRHGERQVLTTGSLRATPLATTNTAKHIRYTTTHSAPARNH